MAFSYQLDSTTMDQFSVVAALDSFPFAGHEGNYIRSSAVGAYNRVLTLPYTGTTSSYFILITSPLNNPLKITQYQSQPPTLPLNSARLYFSTGNYDQYVTSLPLDSKPKHPLALELLGYAGVGYISVDYCRGMMQWEYQPDHGNWAQGQLTT